MVNPPSPLPPDMFTVAHGWLDEAVHAVLLKTLTGALPPAAVGLKLAVDKVKVGGISVHLAQTVVSEFTTVVPVNWVPPIAAATVHHPEKVNPALVGLVSICAPREEPELTALSMFAGPPVKLWLNVTMRGTGVHLAKTVMFAFTTVVPVNGFPPVVAATVHHPEKVNPTLEGLASICAPREEPELTALSMFAGPPVKLWLNVTMRGTGVHLAKTVMFAFTTVVPVNRVPPVAAVNHPEKVNPALVGFAGICAPREEPELTALSMFAGPPVKLWLNVTTRGTGVHLAKTVIFAFTTVVPVNEVPPVAAEVLNHPEKVNPALVGLASICAPREEPELTALSMFAGLPVKLWLNVTVRGTGVHLAKTVMFAFTTVVPVNGFPPVVAATVHHPEKVNPTLEGLAGIFVPREEPELTVLTMFAGPPVKLWLNVTVRLAAAWVTVMFLVIPPPETITVPVL